MEMMYNMVLHAERSDVSEPRSEAPRILVASGFGGRVVRRPA